MQLGDRMKLYELATRQVLPRRSYTILRVDIRAAHTYLKNAGKPFDSGFMAAMDSVAAELCSEISGAKFAYAQSDEISVLYTDFDKLGTQPWFAGVVAKQQSVAASIATAELMSVPDPSYSRKRSKVQFDARVFTLPDAVEVANYFIWRQQDAIRNAVHMVARTFLSHKEVQGVSTDELRERLNIDWNDYPIGAEQGRVADANLDGPAPYFEAKPGNWLTEHIPAKPSF